jgi:hypothetical protein
MLLIFGILRTQVGFVLLVSASNIDILELVDILKRIHLAVLVFDTCLLRLVKMFVKYTLVTVLDIRPLLLVYLRKHHINLLYLFLIVLILLVSAWGLLGLLLECPFAFFFFLLPQIFEFSFGFKLVTVVFFGAKEMAVIGFSCSFIMY